MPPPEKKPYLPPVKPAPKPPLEGSKSLREALAQVTHAKPAQAPPPGLKETLQKISPKKDELSPETIRQMLDVDEPKNTQ